MNFVVFTSETQGGILQLSYQLLCSLALKCDVKMVAPEQALAKCPDNCKGSVFSYGERTDNYLSGRQCTEAVKVIQSLNPDRVLFTCPDIANAQVAQRVKRICEVDVIVHDVVPHSTRSLKKAAAACILKMSNKKLYDAASRIVLLSKSSLEQFHRFQPQYANKAMYVPLGAHVPQVPGSVPKELAGMEVEGYALFFGRIDKYKGIDLLLRAFCNRPQICEGKLVIAGNGKLTEDELRLVNNDSDVILINRYISDEEMVWLFEHSLFVCLPYRDATQSGVLPIAYYFGKGVLTTDVPGLSEFVVEGRTGVVASSGKDLSKWLWLLLDDSGLALEFGRAAREYYERNLDWDKNIDLVIESN